MAAAKSPEQRQALMAEHMKLMQDGMAMMGGASMGGMGEMQGQKSQTDEHERPPEDDGNAHGNDAIHDANDDGSHARVSHPVRERSP